MTRLACRVGRFGRHDWIELVHVGADGRTLSRVPLYCAYCARGWPTYRLARAHRRRRVANVVGALVIVLVVALVTFAVLALADDMVASNWGGLA